MALRDYFPSWLRGSPASTALTKSPTVINLSATQSQTLTQGARVAAKEFGTSGTENFGGYIRREDINPEFDDWQRSCLVYEKMRHTDSMIRAILQAIKLPLRGATWQVNAATNDPVDKRIAEFVNDALLEDDAMEEDWDFVLRHILLQLDFGTSVLEKVWKVDEDGYYRFKRLAPRLPKTIREWHVDEEGKLLALVQYAPVPHPSGPRHLPNGSTSYPRYGGTVSYKYLTIPADYLAIFPLEREGDNYQGKSLLRNCYRNYWYKDQAYHVMGVGLDRWGIGIPIAALEEGHNLSVGDQEKLREILKAIRSNERAYMVMPEHVNFRIEPSGSGQGTQSHFGISWIEHNDSQMARSVLASFLTMGRDPHGTLGFGSRLTDMFISSLDGIASGICAQAKRQLIRPLCDNNFDMARRKYPDLACIDLEQVDMQSLVDTLAKLTGTIITPQDDDESLLRKMMGLPKLDKAGARKMQKPQNVAQSGVVATDPNAPPPVPPGGPTSDVPGGGSEGAPV